VGAVGAGAVVAAAGVVAAGVVGASTLVAGAVVTGEVVTAGDVVAGEVVGVSAAESNLSCELEKLHVKSTKSSPLLPPSHQKECGITIVHGPICVCLVTAQ
jgi:hypothetical protein